MRLRRFVATILAALTSTTAASSTERNPLNAIAVLKSPAIHTPNHRVTYHQSFELTFSAFERPTRLKLEPNHDILPDGATVTYLGEDGFPDRSEVIVRGDHKVYKGSAWVQNLDGTWRRAGWARITVRRDGPEPIVSGAYRVDGDHVHVQLASYYSKGRHALDPEVEVPSAEEEEYMVVWRDSDIARTLDNHEELRRRMYPDLDKRNGLDMNLACGFENLGFNMAPEHPVYSRMLKREDSSWSLPLGNYFDRRQSDTGSGGNSAGVDLVSTIGNKAGCPTTRKVALVGVATDCTYTAEFTSQEDARSNVIDVMNTASAKYDDTFSITLGLKNLTISPSSCPTTPTTGAPWNEACSDNVNIQDRLNTFSQWRGEQSDENSHWTLLTNCKSGAAVGLAWLGQACVQGSQVSNSSTGEEIVAAANVVAKTSTEWQVIAHETGHTFGAVHDCDSQTCNDGYSVAAAQCCPLSSSTCDAGGAYIMNPSTSFSISDFSQCSVGNICSAMLRKSVDSSCLIDNKGVGTLITGQQCGNGIVEEGEECDCGGSEGCAGNTCCDPSTCKFTAGSVCDDSNEDCCTNCQLSTNGTVCRNSTGDCDPEETCTGSSATCPEDVTKPDGEGCGSGLQCASGQCTSRDLQCKTVMGSYTSGNDTYACDSQTCVLSCASPEFGSGVCYGLQQNFLDGTECSGGGKCSNGQCQGSSVAKEVGSWINDHKTLVIAIAASLGGIILLSILGCIFRCVRRRQHRKKLQRMAQQWGGAPPGGGYYASGARRSSRSGSSRSGGRSRGSRSRPHLNGSDSGPLMSHNYSGPPGPGQPGFNQQNSNQYYQQFGQPPPPAFQPRSVRYA